MSRLSKGRPRKHAGAHGSELRRRLPPEKTRHSPPVASPRSGRTTPEQSGSLVLIASPSPQVRWWWSQCLSGMYATLSAATLAGVRQGLVNRKPPLLILALELPGLGGVSGLPALSQLSPLTKVLLLSAAPQEAEAIAALKEGAHGYCSREIDVFLLKKAVETIQKGEIWVKPSVVEGLLQKLRSSPLGQSAQPSVAEDSLADRFHSLTFRDREIAQREESHNLASADRHSSEVVSVSPTPLSGDSAFQPLRP